MGNSVSKVEKKTSSRRAASSAASRSAKQPARRAPKPSVKATAKRTPAAKASANKAKSAAVAPKAKSAKKATRAVKPAAPAKSRPASKSVAPAAAKSSKKTAAQSKPSPAKAKPTATAAAAKPKPSAPSARQTVKPAPVKQPSRDEAAALAAFERAHREFTRGRFEEARRLFQSLIEQHAGVSEVTARARTYLAIAESRVRAAAEANASSEESETLYDRGVIELNRGAYVAALELFERALKGAPNAAHVHYAVAAARARLGASEAALQSLERAVELYPLLRVRAQHDPDLAALRSAPEFEQLISAAR